MTNNQFRDGRCFRSLCGGFGAVGSGGIAGRVAGASGAAVAHYTGPRTAREGQACHQPVHARRPLACRHVRSQAGAGEVRGAAAGLGGSAHGTPDRRTAAFAVPVSEVRAERRSKSANWCRRLGSVIDEICVIRSMYTFNPTHMPARSLFHSGSILATRPSTGAWISYGLGTENENLPAFVVLSPDRGERDAFARRLPAGRASGHHLHATPKSSRRR